jgi:triosephosphate isomerase
MSPERTPFIAGNWKMYKTVAEAEAYVAAVTPRIQDVQNVDAAICVPFTALAACVEMAAGTQLDVFAQNMHEAPEGPYTGEISAPMLTELGVDGVVLGHSERRQYYNETDRALQHKLPAAISAGLHPILCVGETEEERERGDTERRLRHQVQEALHGLAPEDIAKVTIAYEPIWAIGTGKSATPEQAQEAIGFVRALVGDRAKAAAEVVRVLYGGSVKAENAAELLALPDVDGALVGGASLDPESFAAIVRAAGS